MINTKPRGKNSDDDDRMRLFCTLRHFPELRKSLAATGTVDVKKVTIPPEPKVVKKAITTAEQRTIDESRKHIAKERELRSSALPKVEDPYVDLRHYMREHRHHYREERRSCMKHLGTASDADSAAREPTQLERACEKLATTGIYIDTGIAYVEGKCDDGILQREVRQCGLRQVLDLPPYISLPDPTEPIELSSAPCRTPNRPSWRPPSAEQAFRQLLRRRLEEVLCVRLSDKELLALYEALYRYGAQPT